MLKLAVLDIDGTMVDNKGRLSKKTIDTIQSVKKTGALVTICTGRNITKTLPIAKQAGIAIPFVCIDGTILFDPVKKSMIKDMRLSKEEAYFVLNTAKCENTFIEVSDGVFYYKYIPHKDMLQYDLFNKHTLLGRMKSYMGKIRYVSDFEKLKRIKEPFYQIVVASEKNVLCHVSEKIKQGGFERIEIRDYLWEKYLFINRQGIKKSQGVQMLCEYFGVSMDEVVAIGDERNDIDMIEMAGVGVAMGNAVESVKRVADFITDTNEKYGAAKALEKYFL